MLVLSGNLHLAKTILSALRSTARTARPHRASTVEDACIYLGTTGSQLVLIDAALDGGLNVVNILRQRYPAAALIAFNVIQPGPRVSAWGIFTFEPFPSVECGLQAFAMLIAATAQAAGSVGNSRPPARKTASDAAVRPLTAREREVADMLATGESNKDIARLLNISLATVKSHVHSVLRKHNVSRRGKVGVRQLTQDSVVRPSRAAEPRSP